MNFSQFDELGCTSDHLRQQPSARVGVTRKPGRTRGLVGLG